MCSVNFSKLTNPDFWKKPRPFWLGLLVLVGIVIIVLVSLPEQTEISKESKIIPSEGIPLASGKQTYDILTNSSRSFKIIEVDIDPLDVKQGETQIVTVQVKDDEQNPITQENKVEAIVFTDNISTPFSLSLTEASGQNSITVWEGSWVCQDTYNLRYTMTIKAKNASGEHSIDLTFR